MSDGPGCPKCRAGWNARRVEVWTFKESTVSCAICGHVAMYKHGRIIKRPKNIKPITMAEVDELVKEAMRAVDSRQYTVDGEGLA